MIAQFEKLTGPEQELLLKAPVLLSVLASCSTQGINKTQKADAIKLAHIKTFTAIPLLQPYYREVEKTFREKFEEVAATYYPFDEKKRDELKREVSRVNEIIKKLDLAYGGPLSKGLERYATHVKRATHSIYQDFMFPMILLNLTHH
jgi:hypothetical protein